MLPLLSIPSPGKARIEEIPVRELILHDGIDPLVVDDLVALLDHDVSNKSRHAATCKESSELHV